MSEWFRWFSAKEPTPVRIRVDPQKKNNFLSVRSCIFQRKFVSLECQKKTEK